ncbi:hypothetical protein F5141DRAFT_1068329 [Pisolithus sp. B1]|nr:hypothetical protein F5141DRAFT_1068329 [Pisolithus sp. B1]
MKKKHNQYSTDFMEQQAAELGFGTMAGGNSERDKPEGIRNSRSCSGRTKGLFGVKGEEENVAFYKNFMNQELCTTATWSLDGTQGADGVLAYEQKVEEIGRSDDCAVQDTSRTADAANAAYESRDGRGVAKVTKGIA